MLLGIAGALGISMGLGRLQHKFGCALLCTAPFLLFVMIAIEPAITGERQSSTAALAIPFGTFWIAAAAASGILVGGVISCLAKR